MAQLELTFEDIYTLVSKFWGKGSSPSGQDLTDCKNMVYRGYRQFLFPINPRTGRKHLWSFLKKHLVITTDSGQWQYELPQNFRNTITGFYFDKEDGFPPIEKTTPEDILQKRAYGVVDNYPHYYALIKTPYDQITGANWQIWFYGVPDGKYNIHTIYLINPEKPTETTDVFVGGVEASEAILETCLSIVETQEDEKPGIHYAESQRLIRQLIENDYVGLPDGCGKNLDPGVYRIKEHRFLEALQESDVYPT